MHPPFQYLWQVVRSFPLSEALPPLISKIPDPVVSYSSPYDIGPPLQNAKPLVDVNRLVSDLSRNFGVSAHSRDPAVVVEIEVCLARERDGNRHEG